jgi:hypothetical protein
MGVMDREAVKTSYSDEWWFHRLFEAFFERKPRRDGKYRTRPGWADYLWNWYEGTPELPQHTEGWQSQVTKDVLKMGRANLAMLAVESKLDRIQLLGFHPTDSSDDDANTSGPEFTARKLIEKYGTVFDDALLYASVMSDGYIWVGEQSGRDDLAKVTAEDPRSCVTIDDPTDPSHVIAALKMYRNNLEKLDYAHVVLPAKEAKFGEDIDPETGEPILLEAARGHRIRVATRASRSIDMSSNWTAGGGWEWNDALSGEFPDDVQDRGAMVHHVRAPNGIGDIEPVIDNLTRINNMIVDRLWISKFQAFRQRAMQEKESADAGDRPDPMPTHDPDTGEEIDWDSILSADPGAVWRLPIGMTIWESTPTDLQGALLSVRDDIKEFAATTRTPIYVFTPDAVSGSATGASLAREGQVFKAEKWMKRHSPVFIRACGDALAVSGFPNATDNIELKWGKAERVTMTERAAAGLQAKQAGVPQEAVWEDFMQATPEEMVRWRQLQEKEQARALLFPPTPGAGGAGGGTPTPNPVRPPDQVVVPPTPDPVEEFLNRPPAAPVRQPARG